MGGSGVLWFFWLCHTACGILVPRPGIKSGPPEVKAWSPNHWTAKEVLGRSKIRVMGCQNYTGKSLLLPLSFSRHDSEFINPRSVLRTQLEA